MNEMVIEAVIMAFTVGGIIGGAAALSLRTSQRWCDTDDHLRTIVIKTTRRRR